MIFPALAAGQSVDVRIIDDTGLPVTGLVAATFPAPTYSRAGANADVSWPSLVDLALITTAWTAGGLKERGNGVYRLDVPDAVFLVAGSVTIRAEATNKRLMEAVLDVGQTATSTGIAAALAGVGTIQYLGPVIAGGIHRFVRGSAYSRARGIYPFVRLAKASFALTGATVQLRCETAGHDPVTFTGTLVSYDATYWEIYCDLTATQSETLIEGTGVDQFWVKYSGETEYTAVSQNVLNVLEGIGV